MQMETQKKQMNLGLCLLRVWLSFEVVVDHYWHAKGLTGVMYFLSATRSLAVPCFLLMSFYLTANRYSGSDGTWLKTRFGRLCIPYFIWPVVYFVLIWVAAALSPAFVTSTESLTEFKHYGFNVVVDGWDLVRQWLCGIDRRLVHQFWFHNNLIILTAAMFVLLKFVKDQRRRIYTLTALAMAGFALQYSPLNMWLFGRFDFEVKYSFGRLAATLPYAAIGLMIGFNRKRLAEIKGSMRTFLALSGLFLLFFVFYSNAMPRPKGLGYQGLNLILMALGTVAFFHYLPLERVPGWLAKGIDLVSRYCMGIYCCHLAIGWVLHAWLFPHIGVGHETFGGCLWIWVASWFCCWLIAQIPGRFSKDLVQ